MYHRRADANPATTRAARHFVCVIAYLMAYVRAYKGDVMLCRTERPMAEKSKIVNSLREKKVLR